MNRVPVFSLCGLYALAVVGLAFTWFACASAWSLAHCTVVSDGPGSWILRCSAGAHGDFFPAYTILLPCLSLAWAIADAMLLGRSLVRPLVPLHLAVLSLLAAGATNNVATDDTAPYAVLTLGFLLASASFFLGFLFRKPLRALWNMLLPQEP